MDDRVQFREAPFVKGQPRQHAAIEQTVRSNDPRPEVLDDLRVHGLARLHQCAADVIRRENMGAALGEHGSDRTLAAAQPACQSYAQHGFLPSSPVLSTAERSPEQLI
jgi:hypothetical protein